MKLVDLSVASLVIAPEAAAQEPGSGLVALAGLLEETHEDGLLVRGQDPFGHLDV